jgi:hypothetical protein
MNPVTRMRLPRATSTGNVPVAEPKSACATFGGVWSLYIFEFRERKDFSGLSQEIPVT